MTTSTIYTIGHSNKSFEEFAALLTDHDIQTVADARSYPRSRWPWFTGPALAHGLEVIHLRYEQRGRNIGGKGSNVDFDETLDDLTARTFDGERIAIMCSEGDYKGCHRWSMLTPPLLRRGLTVQHIRWSGSDVVQHPTDTIPQAPQESRRPLF